MDGFTGEDQSDMIVVRAHEDELDVEARLDRVTAPTLALGCLLAG